ncbi:MAG: helix-turn-helix transcriptional regulator [Pseudonocardia sp.]
MSDTIQRRLLTMMEVHALTGTPVDTLRFWRHKGVGPKSFRLGRRVVYDRSDVELWIAEQRAGGDAA